MKIAAIAAGVGIVVGTIVGALAFPVDKVVFQDKIVEVPVIQEKIVEKEVPVPFNVTVEKLVEVDNGDMAFVLDRLEDKNIIDDAEEIVAELKAEDAAMKLALDFDEAELFDMLEDKNIVEDEDEVEIIKVYDDFEDVEILRSDFDDELYKFKFQVKIEDLDAEDKMKVELTVVVEDGEAVLKRVEKL